MFQLTELPLSDAALRRSAEEFLHTQGLRLEAGLETFLVAQRDDEIVACGGLAANVLKCLAVKADERGEGLLTLIVSRLISVAAERGYTDTMLFTKPQYRSLFEDMGYTLEAQSPKAVLMTSNPLRIMTLKKEIVAYRNEMVKLFHQKGKEARFGVIVLNADPPTLGHEALISHAAKHCDALYVFLTDNPSPFMPTAKRREIIENVLQEAEIPALLINDTFTLSAGTFPTYFLKESGDAAETEMRLNLDLFRRLHIPLTGVSVRFVGSEPFDELTRRYNELMREMLPIEIDVLPRVDRICASAVRRGPLLPVAHTVSWEVFQALFSQYMKEAMLEELNLTPKPGLVDKDNCGAHTDMNYDTMLCGIEAAGNLQILSRLTRVCATFIRDYSADGRKKKYNKYWAYINKYMLDQTNGVNTHKGFMFAAVCIAIGLGMKCADNRRRYIGPVTPRMLQKAIKEAASFATPAPYSHASEVRRRYGVGGAIAMAQSGYASLFDSWLPLWRQTHDKHRLLLTIMSQLDDTCVLHRGGKRALTWVKHQARNALEDLTPEHLARMNDAFVERSLSPGGSADMFALTLFIDKLV